MILPIVQAGDPVLRAPARPLSLDEIQSTAIQQLIADMRETMRAAPGVGLAAPQVGLGLQLAVIEDAPEYHANATPAELAERERTVVPFHVIINPALTLEEGAPVEFFEGCLSVDGWMALVPRALAVRVDALDENGRDVQLRARGWHARILQHEIDHLHGTLCVDRMDPRTLSSHANYSKLWRGRSVAEVRAGLHSVKQRPCIYLRVLARWDQAARTRPPAEPFTVDDFLAWCFTVYQSVEKRLPTGRQIAVYQSVGSSLPTGRGNPDTGQARSIAELVATFPLPDGDAPGC